MSLHAAVGVVALAVVLRIGIAYQRGLSYREVVAIEWMKTHGARHFNAWLTRRFDRPLTQEAHTEDFIGVIEATPREIVSGVRPPFQPNLFSTAKYRTHDDNAEWAHSQWAEYYDRDGEPWQTHVYLFPVDGQTAVYAHTEPSVTDPDAHEGGEQQRAGDVDGRFVEAWGDE